MHDEFHEIWSLMFIIPDYYSVGSILSHSQNNFVYGIWALEAIESIKIIHYTYQVLQLEEILPG